MVFYLSYSIWLICILTWAAYNLGLLKKTFLPLPERHNLATPEDDLTLEHIFTPNFLNVRYWDIPRYWCCKSHRRVLQVDAKLLIITIFQRMNKRTLSLIKTVLFILYCLISVVGAALAFLRFVPFSIYLLGILLVAMLVSAGEVIWEAGTVPCHGSGTVFSTLQRHCSLYFMPYSPVCCCTFWHYPLQACRCFLSIGSQ